MKAAMYCGQKDIRIEDIQEPPSPPAGFVKVEVEWCGICGSDLHEYLAGPILIPSNGNPVVLGHEFSGTVVEVGEGVPEVVKKGDKVAAIPGEVCGQCYHCRTGNYNLCLDIKMIGFHKNGAFTNYVNVPWQFCVKLPEGVTTEQAALTEPFAVAMHAMRRVPLIQGDRVALIGAGPIGLAALQCALVAGASDIIVIEKSKIRRDYAKKIGATVVLDPIEVDVVAEVLRLTDGIGVDIAYDCAGVEIALKTAINITRSAGTVGLVALHERAVTMDINTLVATEKKLVPVWAYNVEFDPVLKLFADGRLNPEVLISNKIKLDDIVEKGFEELLNNKDKNLKILVSI